MGNNYQEQIEERINNSEKGSMFIPSDFSDIADTNAVRKALSRLLEREMIRRIMRSVYEYPEYSSFLGEYVTPSPDKVAHALARNYGWTIVPSGDTALNMLGMSTQVSAAWTYVSDGPYKEYGFDKVVLRFKHTTCKDLSKVSYKTMLLVQAIKTIGKENFDEKAVKKIAKTLSNDEKSAVLIEAKYITAWVYSIIKKICNGGEIPWGK